MELPNLIDNQYRIENVKLGSGGFSDVFLGKRLSDNQRIAIKRISLLQKKLKEVNMFDKLNLEIALMQKLNHPNIVTYYDVVKKISTWYIIMEYCNAGTLEDVIKFNAEMELLKNSNFNTEENTFYYMNQLKNALTYVRKLGYIHRDIKPMNVLLTYNETENLGDLSDSGTVFKCDEQLTQQTQQTDKNNYNHTRKLIVKLADFGLAKLYEENESSLISTICGSPMYMAPELIIERKYNSSADLWSYGIIMYQLLFGKHPNDANSLKQLINNLKNKNINFHLSKNFSTPCFDLLTNLLVKDPRKRIDWNTLDCHKWFKFWINKRNAENDIIIGNDSLEDIMKIEPQSTLKKTKPIKITACDQSNQLNQSDQSDKPGSINSPLGQSNLSRMAIGNYYPCSYPPANNCLTIPFSDTNHQLSKSTWQNIICNNCPASNVKTSQSWEPSVVQKSTSRSRIFRNFSQSKII